MSVNSTTVSNTRDPFVASDLSLFTSSELDQCKAGTIAPVEKGRVLELADDAYSLLLSRGNDGMEVREFGLEIAGRELYTSEIDALLNKIETTHDVMTFFSYEQVGVLDKDDLTLTPETLEPLLAEGIDELQWGKNDVREKLRDDREERLGMVPDERRVSRNDARREAALGFVAKELESRNNTESLESWPTRLRQQYETYMALPNELSADDIARDNAVRAEQIRRMDYFAREDEMAGRDPEPLLGERDVVDSAIDAAVRKSLRADLSAEAPLRERAEGAISPEKPKRSQGPELQGGLGF